MPGLIFLKLGGSLITDKARPFTPRREKLAALAGEIQAAWQADPGLSLLLGHGSGSFGHVAAQQHGTRQGVSSPQGWLGFAQVWRQASALNRLVIEALHQAGLPALSFPPSAMLTARSRRVAAWDLQPLRQALAARLLPVIYGDVVFDLDLGGTIFSTEDLFTHLAGELQPRRILLAGMEEGVWADFPACTRLVPHLTPAGLAQVAGGLGGSAATDVTGGMLDKVQQSLAWVKAVPGLEVHIFSGERPGAVGQALLGGLPGTRLTVDIPPHLS